VKFLDEYRNADAVRALVKKIEQTVTQPAGVLNDGSRISIY